MFEQRSDPLVYQLGARRRVQQRLGPRSRSIERRVLDQLSDPLRQRHPARLAQQLDSQAPRGDRLHQRGRERRLARPVQALDRDQPAASHERTVARVYDDPVTPTDMTPTDMTP